MNPQHLPKVRSEAIMAAMAGFPCTLRIASLIGERCAPQATVVGCHLPVWGKGTSSKVTDLAVVAGCRNCHDLLDRVNPHYRVLWERYPRAYGERLIHALTETHALLVAEGVIVVPGATIEGKHAGIFGGRG